MECHKNLSPTETSSSPVTFGKPLQHNLEYNIIYPQRFTLRRMDRQTDRKNKPDTVTVPPMLCQLPPERLGTALAASTIRVQWCIQRIHEENTDACQLWVHAYGIR